MDTNILKKGYLLKEFKNLSILSRFFDQIPVDPYYGEDGFRRKSLSRFKIKNGNLTILPHEGFFQGENYNPIAGGIVRNYPPMEDILVKKTIFGNFMSLIATTISAPVNTVYTVHQVRVLASKKHAGLAVAEGIHQDGYDYVVLGCAGRTNLSGSITELYLNKAGGVKLFEQALTAGDVLFVDDKKLFHYTTPLDYVGNEICYRDIFIVTISLSGIIDIKA